VVICYVISCTLIDNTKLFVKYSATIYRIHWRWKQKSPPKLWCPSMNFHDVSSFLPTLPIKQHHAPRLTPYKDQYIGPFHRHVSIPPWTKPQGCTTQRRKSANPICKSYVSMIRLHTRTRSLQASIYGLGIISPTSAHTWKNVYLLANCRFVGREKLPRRRLASRLAQWHHTIRRDHASRPSSVVDTTGNYRLWP